ncbi:MULTISPECIES: hypothetical protein [Pyrobaculum]|uniref:Uncharacterized protein n=2 Tax=Pyrobaculum arsenaticum TaxID=121277 RepID=A4WKJ5_PYRAR|nr:hypothetical protein [Pyrobaculum arsenaticum]ABP50912.1 conserved hypothetical protein [Pyrobaculum arsenaticum DSM 13514]MCY0891299.1 hypothetical protein [Pyrobaculum arsenaticum]NYR15368.1 hypothetical protein [Pyrobaculum arsenaticum]
MSILKRKQKKDEEEDELERILSELKQQDDEKSEAVSVTIQIAGLKELVKAIEKLTEAVNKCGEQ